jgi:hypothetical protein
VRILAFENTSQNDLSRNYSCDNEMKKKKKTPQEREMTSSIEPGTK